MTGNYQERFYALEEEEIQEIIARYKSGDPKALSELLEVFRNFIMKYTAVLFEGKYSLQDSGIRRFISLFIGDPVLNRHLRKQSLNTLGRKKVIETFRGITYMINRYCDIDDVTQTVEMTFLQCVNRYERRDSIPFSGFLFNYFFYLLKKNVEIYLIDQLGRKTFPLILQDDSSDNGDDTVQQGFREPIDIISSDEEQNLSTDIIDQMWVLGETSSDIFKDLSVDERQLLKWRYVDGLKASQISEITTEHPNTVREHIHKLRQKLINAIDKYGYDDILYLKLVANESSEGEDD